jgi:flavin reductase (DIM6/NTAB) family NADH-FMN oxidoreductase RutF
MFDMSGQGIPVLRGALGSIGCRLVQRLETGDHITVIGEAVGMQGGGEGDVLLLKDSGWRYRRPKGEHPWQR